MAITQPGAKHPKHDPPADDDEGEESDEYEVPDDEGENDDDDEDEEDEEEESGGLTALLLGGGEDADAEDQGWVPDGGKEPADYSGEEGEEEYSEKPPEKGSPSKGVAGGKANGSPAKRAREEEEADAREGKRTKKV